MTAIELVNAEIGTVSSRADGSVAFRVITAELRPSEAGAVLAYHGKACSVLVRPHEGAPEELVRVSTEREQKTPGSRLRAVLFIHWKQLGEAGRFEEFYAAELEKYINHVKGKLDPL